jgi:3-phosphoshikimate 1-carboxyvinyltransferase
MIANITSSTLSGTLKMPPSKSVMQRLCALAVLHDGTVIIKNPGRSKDDIAALGIIENLGALIIDRGDTIEIKSNGIVNPNRNIHCGESGLSLRMFAPIIALSSTEVLINGNGSLLNRPLHPLNDIFSQLNVNYSSNNNYLPLSIKGPMLPHHISLDGASSSQYLTGLLFALGAVATDEIFVDVRNLVSKPYVELSVALMSAFGYNVKHNNYQQFIIAPRDIIVSNLEFYVEGDWSGAAFFLVAAAIRGSLKLEGLNPISFQPDKKILDVLREVGSTISINKKYLTIKSNGSLNGFDIDATDCPDLFPPLVVLALFCNGVSKIKGVKRLVHKESNRAMSLIEEFSKLGATIFMENDDLIIEGNKTLKAGIVSSHNDHRIAMALSVAALAIDGETSIHNADSVEKSFPAFFNLLQLAGASVSLIK